MEGMADDLIKLSCESEFGEYGIGNDEVTCMAKIVANEEEEEERKSRACVDIVIIVDKSSSMEGNKLQLVKKTCEFIVRQLKSNDRLSIISYDSTVSIDIPLCEMTPKNKEKSFDSIHSLAVGDMTNLSGGLFAGVTQLHSSGDPNRVGSILLFTDGLANQGLRNTNQIVNALGRSLQKAPGPVSVFTFGFGSDHDEGMLNAIADVGNGMYYFIEKPDSIPEAFADCVGGLLSISAQNLLLSAIFIQGTSYKGLLGDYRVQENLDSVEIQLGDLYSGETRNILFKASLPQIDGPTDSFSFIKFSLTFFDVMTGGIETITSNATVKRAPQPSSQTPDIDVASQRNRVIVAQGLAKASEMAKKGKLTEARGFLKNIQDTTPHMNAPQCQNLAADLQECQEDLQDTMKYKQRGAQNLASKSRQHSQQRSAGYGNYETSAKARMKNKMKKFY